MPGVPYKTGKFPLLGGGGCSTYTYRTLLIRFSKPFFPRNDKSEIFNKNHKFNLLQTDSRPGLFGFAFRLFVNFKFVTKGAEF